MFILLIFIGIGDFIYLTYNLSLSTINFFIYYFIFYYY